MVHVLLSKLGILWAHKLMAYIIRVNFISLVTQKFVKCSPAGFFPNIILGQSLCQEFVNDDLSASTPNINISINSALKRNSILIAVSTEYMALCGDIYNFLITRIY